MLSAHQEPSLGRCLVKICTWRLKDTWSNFLAKLGILVQSWAQSMPADSRQRDRWRGISQVRGKVNTGATVFSRVEFEDTIVNILLRISTEHGRLVMTFNRNKLKLCLRQAFLWRRLSESKSSSPWRANTVPLVRTFPTPPITMMRWIYSFIPNVTSHPKWLWCSPLSEDSDLMALEGIPGSCITTGLRQFCFGSLLSKVKTADPPNKAHTPEQDLPGAPWPVWLLPPFSISFLMLSGLPNQPSSLETLYILLGGNNFPLPAYVQFPDPAK